jgi:hypothetical protein
MGNTDLFLSAITTKQSSISNPNSSQLFEVDHRPTSFSPIFNHGALVRLNGSAAVVTP